MISFRTPPATLFEGSEASGRIPSTADTVEVTCRYTGGQTARAVWGRGEEEAFVYLQDSTRPDVFASDPDAQGLYQALMSGLVTQQSFVNSDPRSPEHFTPDRSLSDVAGEVNDSFGTAVEDVM